MKYTLMLLPLLASVASAQDDLWKTLKKGDRVVTSGGIYGTIQGVEPEVVYLKIAENVKVKVTRSAITGVLTSEGEQQS